MLAVQELSKSFGARAAVNGVSFEVGPGEVFGLLGPNGAGKTTIAKMCVGLLRPDRGSVRVGAGGFTPPANEAQRCIGVAPQDLAIYVELSAEENLRLFAALYGHTPKESAARAREALGAVGLADRARGLVKTFSGGMKRRLNFAAAILNDPEVVLLDEPTAGVDPQSRAGILDLVRGLKQRGKAVVYTTHYMEEAQRLCDRVGIIDQGRLLALGTVPELIAAHGGPETIVLGRDDGEERIETTDPLNDLARLLAGERGRGARTIRLERADLESVFLRLTGRALRDE